MFREAVVATAILDRLLHHSHAITISGGSGVSRESRFQVLRIDRDDLPSVVIPKAIGKIIVVRSRR